MERGLLLGGCLAALLASPAPASTRVDFNQDWQFRTDPDRTGEASGWTKSVPAGTRSVRIPHTWNIGEFHDYLGIAWYFRRFEMPPIAPGTHVELHFGATFYAARVWLNGVELGAHEGGFTAYSFDISAQLHGTNVLAVQIDNRPGAATIPGFGARGTPDAWYDWWALRRHRSGRVADRERACVDSPPEHPQRHEFRSGGDPRPCLPAERSGAHSAAPRCASPPMSRTISRPRRATQPVRSCRGTGGRSWYRSRCPSPKLWSIDHPNVYRMEVELVDGSGKVLDEHSDTFGLRTVEIRDRHLLLNGERVRLTGLARHEDSPWEGLAETQGTMRHDFDDMKALHATLSRPVHYPQNPFILDYADRHGILLIPEIPVWQFDEAQLANPAVLALARQQMQEMIEQAGNHPSIFAWSVANESATATAGGIAYFRAMRDLIRKLDPGRFVSYADDNLPKLERAEQSAANDADFLMMNQYFGTWHGPASALVPALDRVNQLFPEQNGHHLGIRIPRILRRQPGGG